MTVKARAYEPETDFMRVRQFLFDTYRLYGYHYNWGPTRWEFVRYFVCSLHSVYRRKFSVPVGPAEVVVDELAAWERTIRVWEDEGEIVAVVHSENEEPAEVWTEMRPGFEYLYAEMLDWAEANLADVAHGLGFCKLYVNEGSRLQELAEQRGYRHLEERCVHRNYAFPSEMPLVTLPDGLRFCTVADEDDPLKRAKVHTLAFGRNYAPSEWGPIWPYTELQKAPSYDPANDLLIVAPDGEYVAFGTMWMYPELRMGQFEPVGVHPDYQRKGLGTLLLGEGFRRMAARGCTYSTMDAGNPFYQKVGFRDTPHAYSPWIRYWPA